MAGRAARRLTDTRTGAITPLSAILKLFRPAIHLVCKKVGFPVVLRSTEFRPFAVQK